MLDVSSVNYDMIFRRYDILVESKEKPEDIAAKILPKDALLKKVAEDVVFMKYKDIES
ncbi:MAG TPA: methanol--corrinoid methyltransferase, partial [Thermoplasmata archaeon]